MKYKWKAIDNDGLIINQFNNDIETKFADVEAVKDNLKSFSVLSDDGEGIIIDFENQIIFSINNTGERKVIITFADGELYYARRNIVKYSISGMEIDRYIIYRIGVKTSLRDIIISFSPGDKKRKKEVILKNNGIKKDITNYFN